MTYASAKFEVATSNGSGEDTITKNMTDERMDRRTTNRTLLQQGISEPIFYGDLVYKFKRIVGKPNFSDQFKKIIKRYIRVGYHATVCMPSFKPNHGL